MSTAARALGLVLLACSRQLAAADPSSLTPPPAAPDSALEDRLLFSADGATLTGGSGGGGASGLWLHTLAPREVIGAGAEYQQIADAHWTNAVVSGSFGLGAGPGTAVFFEAHEGAGDVAQRGFRYSVVVAGLLVTPVEWLNVQLEERRIDVDTSHGNLPKLTLSFHASKSVLVSASYADAAGGNLGTQLTTLRVDYVGQGMTALAGVAGGRAAPAVLNLLGQVVEPSPTLKELFAGVGRAFGRTDWQLLADYQDLAGGFKRTTVTLLCTLHLDRTSRPP